MKGNYSTTKFPALLFCVISAAIWLTVLCPARALTATVPDAPTIGAATPANTQVTVAFTIPASDGGSPITDYTVTADPGGQTKSGAASPLVVTDLSNGTAYTFTVKATNVMGVGAESPASASVTPATVPDAPAITQTTPDNGQVTVYFSAPFSNGGSPITGYTVTANPGGNSVTGASPLIVPGLVNGTPYTFTVKATNVMGVGAESPASASVTPATVPDAPAIIQTTPGNGQVTVSFSTPASNGGSALISYTVTASPDGNSVTGAASPLIVPGLVNGTAYTFTVKATNGMGAGAESLSSAPDTPATVPYAPAISTATPANTQVAVAFTPPVSNGGSPITGYTVTADPGGQTKSGASSPLVVVGLTNGTAYTFSVKATNGMGDSLLSQASDLITPIPVPDAPTISTATPANTQVAVAFTTPASDGGSPITGYTVTADPGGQTQSGASGPLVVTGLSNGTAYTFTVKATNGVGDSLPSQASDLVTPATVPDAPAITQTKPGNGQVTVSFSAPAFNGGSPLTSYTVTANPGGKNETGAASPLIVKGLVNGTPYTFTVKATNGMGEGAESLSSAPDTPATVPGAPAISAATPANTQVAVAFTPPASDGGSPITGYMVIADPGGQTQSGASGPLVVTGLSNGTAYTFSVKATNGMGNSPPSAASVSVIPASIPGIPAITGVTPGSGQATVSFNPPAFNGGSAITDYTVTSSPDGKNVSGTTSPLTITGLTSGTAYTFTAQATNAVGVSLASLASMSITPGAPFLIDVLRGTQSAAAGDSFTVALKNNGKVAAWGDNSSNQTEVPTDLGPVKAVAAGSKHTVVLLADGTVKAWGDDTSLQTKVPADLGPVRAIAASRGPASGGAEGRGHTVALQENGVITAWGDDSEAQISGIPSTIGKAIAIAAGDLFTVAVKEDGTVAVWGDNTNGQKSSIPAGLSGVTEVAAGRSHILALKSDGTVVAWGLNHKGQTDVPSGLNGVTAIAVGWDFSLALKDDGTVVAWGDGSDGQTTVPANLAATAIAAGASHTIAITTDGALHAWGLNIPGQNDLPMGLATPAAHGAMVCPAPVSGASTCTVTPDLGYTLATFAVNGVDSLASVGNGSYQMTNIQGNPQMIASFEISISPKVLTGVKSIATGSLHNVALLYDGTVRAWGTNTNGQTTVPPSLAGVTAVAAGQSHTLALKEDGSVVAWGGDLEGQSSVPPSLDTVTAIAAGDTFSIALKVDGSTVAWGKINGVAVPTTPFTGVKAIAAGASHILAIKNDGTVVTAGGDPSNSGVLNIPAGLSGVLQIAAGKDYSLVLQSDGTVKAWGKNMEQPTGIPTGPGQVKAIAAGRNCALALQADGNQVWVWGDPTNPQVTGKPSNLAGLTQLAAGLQQVIYLKEDGTLDTWGTLTGGATPALVKASYDVPHGSISCLPPVIIDNSSATCTISPAPGYHLASWLVNGSDQFPNVSNDSYFIPHVQQAQTIVAVFAGTITAPGAPLIGQVTPASGQAAIAFTSPSFDGGSAVTSYTVTANPGGNHVTGAASPLIVQGLVNGTSYTFTVKATNVMGDGAESAPSSPVTPATVPDPPTITGVARGNGQATLGFTAPSFDGGSAITGYTVSVNPGGKVIAATSNPMTVTGLTNGTAYTFKVKATNGVGDGGESAPYSVIPAAVPGIPLLSGVTPASGQATVAFTYPSFDGGSAITGYTVTATPGGKTVSGPTSPLTVTGLTDGIAYTFTVQAANAVGLSPASPASAGITPGTPFLIDLLSGTKSVAAGDTFTVALKKNGKVAAWGDNTYHQTEVPADLGPVKAIAAGSNHTVALLEDGTVKAWGDDRQGQVSEQPVDLGKVIAISASHGPEAGVKGLGNTVALQADGLVRVWGDDSKGQVSGIPADLGKVKAIAAGDQFVVAVKEDGTVESWGDDLSLETPSLPKPGGLFGVRAVAAGRSHILALKDDGTVVAWGLNHKGQADVPAGLSGVIAVAAGWGYSVALKEDGTVVGWGNNDNAQLNVPADLPAVTTIAAGAAHTLAVTADGALHDWGYIDDGNGQAATVPVGLLNPLPHGTVVCPAPANGTSTCTITANSGYALATFAVDGVDALASVDNDTSYTISNIQGNPTITASFEISITPEVLTGVKSIATGGAHNVALLYDGTVQIWGNNDFGQKDVPSGLKGVRAIAAGDNHTLALKDDGTVVAWGWNNNGQVNVPASLNEVMAVAAGDTFSIALKADGSTVSWGKINGAAVPTPFTGVKAIAAGARHILAIKNDGTVVTAGANFLGVLTVPPGLAGVQQIAAGEDYSMALKSDGTVKAWGESDYQQTGVPGEVSQVTAIAAGRKCALALKADGKQVWVWGDTTNQQFKNKPLSLTGLLQIAAGREQVLTLKEGGTVDTWGTTVEALPVEVTNSYGVTHGSATCPPKIVIDNSASQCVITPDSGHHLASWVVNGSDQFPYVSNNSYLIPHVQLAQTIVAVFAKNTAGAITAPGAPLIGQLTPGNLQVGVEFTPPASDGGSSINEYTATASPGGKTMTGAASPIIVTGLTNGTAYTVTLQAKNAAGAGPPSGPSASVTPATIPGAPAITNVTKGDGQATIIFAAPTSNGGSAITGYTVISSPEGKTISGATSPLTLTDLANGTAYTFTVKATNGMGDGAASLASAPVTPATVPGESAITQMTTANGQVTVAFTLPATDGGSAITGYTVTADPGGNNVTGTASPITVPGLENGSSYTFTVKVKNAEGYGPESPASTPAIPATVPGAPAISTVIPVSGQVTVDFTAPASDGGSAISGYTVTASPGGKIVKGTTGPLTLAGLTNGTAYTFTVKATNVMGDGVESTPSSPVTPATVPDQPMIGKVTPGPGQATLTFTAPAANGSAITGYTVTVDPGGKVIAATSSPTTVTGLTNGTAYTFTIKATNGVGDSLTSLASASVTPATVPGAPAISTVTPASGQATVAFTYPSFDGGSAITGYTVTATPGGKTQTGATSPLIVTGLNNGTAYTFTVQAANAVGLSPASPASAGITPGTPFLIDLLSGSKAVAAGDTFTVALKKNGKVAAWGDNTYHQTEVPTDLGPVKAIAAGSNHTVALLEDGTVKAWGDDRQGQVSEQPTDLGKVIAIGASHGLEAGGTDGRGNTVALQADGQVRVWGDDSKGQVSGIPTDLGKVKAIAAGDQFVVAVKEDGTVESWGDDLSLETPSLPKPDGLSGVRAVAAGRAHVLALKEDGTVVAWGFNKFGQADVPAGLSGVIAVAAGWGYSVALKEDGTVVGWGNNAYSQLNVPAGLPTVTTIAAGLAHTLAVTADGALHGWGNNNVGQATVPVGLLNPLPHGAVVCPAPANDISTCTITAEPGYALATFAVDGVDALASVDNDTSYTISNVQGHPTITASFEISITPKVLTGVKSIATGGAHNVALLYDGTVQIWGNNDFGQKDVPAGLKGVEAIAAGYNHTLALKEDGTVVAWGRNIEGQSSVPTSLNGVKSIAAGDTFSVALKTDGSTVAWGKIDGNSVPLPFTGVKQIAAGARHILAIKKDDTVVTAGVNYYDVSTIPAGLTGVQMIAAGEDYSMALKSDGTVKAWGKNDYQQTGVPGEVSQVTAIAAGRNCALALKADGKQVWVWGNTTNPQYTGKPTSITGLVKLAAGREQVLALKEDGTVSAWGTSVEGIPAVVTGSYGLAHGSITCLPDLVIDNSSSVCIISPDQGYHLGTWLVNGSDLSATVANNAFPLANINQTIAVTGSFAKDTAGIAPPGAPAITKLTPGNLQVGVEFIPPDSYGGSPITEYTATASPGGKTMTGAASPIIVTGLTNGAAYTVTIQAKNAAGAGPLSSPSASVTPATVPGAPAITNVTKGNGQATITFTAPTSNGGSAITGYTVTSSPEGKTISGATGPLTITGLANGTAYTFTVKATNGMGEGTASPASVPVTPATVPGESAITQTTSANGQVTVAFTIPAATGGSAITGYTVTASPGGNNVTGTASPITVPGLENGSSYNFTVKVKNAEGYGPESPASVPAIPATVPGAPAISTVTSATGQVTVEFTAPVSNGGSAISGYTVTSNPGGKTVSATTTGPLTLVGLSNGTAYTFTVKATNVMGDGAESAPSTPVTPVTPATVPDQPMITKVTPGNGQATLDFTAPFANGSAITGYTVTVDPGGKVIAATSSPMTVTGLTNGTGYTFTVKATNGVGDSPPSLAFGPVTPAAVPGIPVITGVTPASGQATVAFTASSFDGGSAITSYTVTATPGGKTKSGATSPLTVTGLTDGTAYTFTVQAANAVGLSPASPASASINPGTPFLIDLLSGTKAVAAGDIFSVALKKNGKVAAWGDNTFHQTEVPTDLGPVKAIAAGSNHAVALLEDGTVKAWGDDRQGQVSEQPADLGQVIAIGASHGLEANGVEGRGNTVALQADGQVRVWGDNSKGQVSDIPADLGKVKAIAAGDQFVVAVKEDGTVASWGDDLSLKTPSLPKPAALSGVKSVAAGRSHVLALKDDGTVVAWGLNHYGQAEVPAGLNGVIAVAAGWGYSVALKEDGTVVGWGNNDYSQLNVPAGLPAVTTIAAGVSHTLAVTVDGALHGWGNNDNGKGTVPVGLLNPLPHGAVVCPSPANGTSTCTITVEPGYALATFAVDGVDAMASVDNDTSYTISNIQGNPTITASFEISITLAIPAGWNLLGAWGEIDATQAFSDGKVYTSIWKWENGGWAVRLPADLDYGEQYATSKGFTLLMSIKSGEGFWVNSTQDSQLTVSPKPGTAMTTDGWNLLGQNNDSLVSVSELVQDFTTGTVISLWKWEDGKWAVSLPADPDKGKGYAESKGFTHMSIVKPGEGYWQNCVKQ